MTNQKTPPRWADRFLRWYCNPELLEEIQGDAHELYYDRLQRSGKFVADFKYIWDVIRFCRLSNVRRTEEFNDPGLFGILWNLNMKIAIRNSARNKTVFFAKLSALAICLAFTFLLTGFVINEMSYDHQHKNYDRIYRISSRVDIGSRINSYAISPVPMGPMLVDEVPGIEATARIMTAQVPFGIGDKKFFAIQSAAADTNFLRMFHFDYIHGSPSALDEPERIVLTESLAKRFFGTTDVVGKSLEYGMHTLDVSAVIRDLPVNTHFIFSAFVSWKTVVGNEQWDDFNAYTYIRIGENVRIEDVDNDIATTVKDYISLISEEYQMKYEPIILRIDDIHLSGYLEEDFAPKRNINYVYIILSVIILFLLTGLFNYLNLALAELTTQVKKIAILKTFGGIHADYRKVAITDVVLCLLLVTPIVILIMFLVLSYPGSLPPIEPGIWTSPLFTGIVAGIIVLIIVCSSLNSLMSVKNELMIQSLKGNSAGTQKGFATRKILVAAQLSFSIIMIGLITVIVDQFHFVNNNDKGFDDHDVLVIRRPGSYNEMKEFEETVRGMSGVKMVAGSSYFPEGPIEKKDIFQVEKAEGMKNHLVNYILCDIGYPELLNLRLKEGRMFDEDRSTDMSAGAYLINATAAKEFGWQEPLGKRIATFYRGDEQEGEVIGVIEDFHFESMHTRIEPLIIFLGDGEFGMNYIYVKMEPVHSQALIETIQRAHHRFFPDTTFDYIYLDAHYRGLYKQDYEIRDIFRSGLIISILVSALGIFSISALMLSLRTKEMGIRKVIGAANAQLFAMHLKPFAVFFLIAIAIGLPIVFYLAQRWLNGFAYHIVLDARYFVLPGLITIVIILSASVYHAIRGARVNPADILKAD